MEDVQHLKNQHTEERFQLTHTRELDKSARELPMTIMPQLEKAITTEMVEVKGWAF